MVSDATWTVRKRFPGIQKTETEFRITLNATAFLHFSTFAEKGIIVTQILLNTMPIEDDEGIASKTMDAQSDIGNCKNINDNNKSSVKKRISVSKSSEVTHF